MSNTVTTSEKNGLATASMVCGIIAVALSLIPIINVVIWPLALTSIGLGIAGLVKSRKLDKGKGGAITGLVTSAAAIVLYYAVYAAISDALNS